MFPFDSPILLLTHTEQSVVLHPTFREDTGNTYSSRPYCSCNYPDCSYFTIAMSLFTCLPVEWNKSCIRPLSRKLICTCHSGPSICTIVAFDH